MYIKSIYIYNMMVKPISGKLKHCNQSDNRIYWSGFSYTVLGLDHIHLNTVKSLTIKTQQNIWIEDLYLQWVRDLVWSNFATLRVPLLQRGFQVSGKEIWIICTKVFSSAIEKSDNISRKIQHPCKVTLKGRATRHLWPRHMVCAKDRCVACLKSSVSRGCGSVATTETRPKSIWDGFRDCGNLRVATQPHSCCLAAKHCDLGR